MPAKGQKVTDTFGKWRASGKLPEVLEFIKECSRKLVTQTEMAKHLGINDETFSRMKLRHPEMQKVIDEAKLNLKKDLVGALYRRAMGYEYTDEIQYIEDGGKGKPPKRKIVRTKKWIPEDRYSLVYLLTKNFGVEFYDRKYELYLAEQKILDHKEDWKKDENTEQEDS